MSGDEISCKNRKMRALYDNGMIGDAAWYCVVLRGAAWCCVVLRGAAWCCVLLRSDA